MNALGLYELPLYARIAEKVFIICSNIDNVSFNHIIKSIAT